MMRELADILISTSKCDYCQRLIKEHNYIESLACLQEISKSHSEFVTNYLSDIEKVEASIQAQKLNSGK